MVMIKPVEGVFLHKKKTWSLLKESTSKGELSLKIELSFDPFYMV